MKQLFYIKRDELQNAEQKVLTFCIGKKYFSFAVTSFPDNELYCLGHFTNGCVDPTGLSELFSQHDTLNGSFYKVSAIFDYPEGILVPTSNQNSSELLLKTMNGNIFDSEIIHDSLNDRQLNNVYAVPKPEFAWIKNTFPSLSYNHIYSNLLKFYDRSVGSVINDENDGCLLLDFKPDEFSLIALKEKKILLAQCYSYSTPGDVVYYLLNAGKHFSFSRNKVKLLVSGLIEKHSALFHELCQFFIHVDLREASDWKDVISTETDHEPHYFALLNDLSKCAS